MSRRDISDSFDALTASLSAFEKLPEAQRRSEFGRRRFEESVFNLSRWINATDAFVGDLVDTKPALEQDDVHEVLTTSVQAIEKYREVRLALEEAARRHGHSLPHPHAQALATCQRQLAKLDPQQANRLWALLEEAGLSTSGFEACLGMAGIERPSSMTGRGQPVAANTTPSKLDRPAAPATSETLKAQENDTNSMPTPPSSARAKDVKDPAKAGSRWVDKLTSVFDGPLKILDPAMKRVPALRYALAGVAVAGCAAAGVAYFRDAKVAFIATIVGVGIMGLMLVASKAANLATGVFHYPAVIFVWSCLALFLVWAGAMTTSVLFQWPPALDLFKKPETRITTPEIASSSPNQPSEQPQPNACTSIIEAWRAAAVAPPSPNCLAEGSTAEDDIWDLYKRTNSDVLEALYVAEDVLHSRTRVQRLYYLHAPAASGKTSFLDEVFWDSKKLVTRRKGVAVQIVSLKTHFARAGELPDLVLFPSASAVTSLPGNPNKPEFQNALRSMLTASRPGRPTLFVLDGIDEVSKEAARAIFEYTSDLLIKSKGTFQVFVVGRPEAFTFEVNRKLRLGDGLKFLEFRPPRYTSKAELKLRYDNAATIGADIGTLSEFETLIAKHPFLCETTSNLWLSRQMIISANYLLKKTNDYDVREFLFKSLLDRNHESHGRPQNADPTYSLALEEAALAALRQKTTDEFDFGREDRVRYGEGEVQVTSLLDRSGIIARKPYEASPARYTFAPRWVGRHLLERYARRKGCELR